MSWKKHFSPVSTKNNADGVNSPLSSRGNSGSGGPATANYSSFLPDVYSGAPNRVDRYGQYNTMDQDSEVNAALDILAEFCTQKNPTNGSPFGVEYKKTATNAEITIIKQYLQQWCKLQKFETKMFRIVRNTFKYGDQFFLRDPETHRWLHVDPANVSTVIVNESEGKIPMQYRIQNINFNFVHGIATTPHETSNTRGPVGTQFQPVGGASQTNGQPQTGSYSASRFNTNQEEYTVDAKHVVHLSLSEGLDNNFPFGTSLLETIYKVYKQKELLEDAIIIYRVQRAPERRVFYVDVGNMPPHLAMSFVERVKTEIHQRRIPSSTGGGNNVIDSSYNPLGITEDYFFPACLSLYTNIPLLDGRTLTLKEIIGEYEKGKENFVYGLSNETHELEPAKIEWAGVTRENAEVLRVHLDNGEYVDATPDHKFILRNGDEVMAENLSEGDSLMPLDLRDGEVLSKEERNIKSIENLVCREDTGDITISSASDSHWFGLSSGIYVHNSSEGRGSKVETLPGGCFAMDTQVSLLDGRELSIREIEEEMQDGKTLWAYSCEPKTGKVVPGLISWAGVTQKSAQVMRLTLDSGGEILCTPDHKFPQYGEDFKQAGDFEVGDSLVPLYRDMQPIDGKKSSEYETVFDNADKEWKFTHRVVADDLRDTAVFEYTHNLYDPSKKFGVRHHIDFNRLNNSPENLCFMQHRDHFNLHSESSSEFFRVMRETRPDDYDAYCRKISESNTKRWEDMSDEEYEQVCRNVSEGSKRYIASLSEDDRDARNQQSRDKFVLANKVKNERMKEDPEYHKWHCQRQSDGWTDELRAKRAEEVGIRSKARWNGPDGDAMRERQRNEQSYEFSHNMIKFIIDFVASNDKFTLGDIVAAMNESELKDELYELNKHRSIRLSDPKDGFSLTNVRGMIKGFGYKNYTDLVNKHKTHNHRIVAIEYLNEPMEVGTLTIDQDEIHHGYHTFALSVGVFTKNSSLGEITDLQHFTNKLVRGLRIPSSYLPTGADDSSSQFNDGRVGTAYIQELRFNTYCERLQTLITEEFDQEFKLYLLKRGVNVDTSMFDLKFQEPQNFASYRQSEVDNARVSTYGQMSAIPYISNRFALKRFLGLSDDEIAENERMWLEENEGGVPADSDSSSEMRDAGISSAGIDADLGGLEDELPDDGEPIDAGMGDDVETSTDQTVGPSGSGPAPQQ